MNLRKSIDVNPTDSKENWFLLKGVIACDEEQPLGRRQLNLNPQVISPRSRGLWMGDLSRTELKTLGPLAADGQDCDELFQETPLIEPGGLGSASRNTAARNRPFRTSEKRRSVMFAFVPLEDGERSSLELEYSQLRQESVSSKEIVTARLQLDNEFEVLLRMCWRALELFKLLEPGGFAENKENALKLYEQLKQFSERYLAYCKDGGKEKMATIIGKAVASHRRNLSEQDEVELLKITADHLSKINFNDIGMWLIANLIQSGRGIEIESLVVGKHTEQGLILEIREKLQNASREHESPATFYHLVPLLEKRWVPWLAIQRFLESLLTPLNPAEPIDFSTKTLDSEKAWRRCERLNSRKSYMALLHETNCISGIGDRIEAYRQFLSSVILFNETRLLREKLFGVIDRIDGISQEEFEAEYEFIRELAVGLRNKFSKSDLFVGDWFENYDLSNNRTVKLALVYLMEELEADAESHKLAMRKFVAFLEKLPDKHFEWMSKSCAFIQISENSKYFDNLKLLDAYVKLERERRGLLS